jgi:hypothetical protein
MQTVAWMAYSDSTHFSDKLPYKILFYFKLRLKRYKFCKIAHLQQFPEKQNRDFVGTFLTEDHISPGR